MAQKIMYIVLFLFLQITVYAYRPFMTEDAGVAQLGEQKIELGLIGNRQNEYWYNYISFLYGIGLDMAEIQVETPYCTRGESQGLENVILSAKIHILGIDEETGMLSTKVGYEFPDDCYGISAIVTKKNSKYLIHSQVGIKRHFDDSVALFGLGFDYLLLQDFNIIMDNFIEYDFDALYHRIMVGLIYSINDLITVDVATGYCYEIHHNNYREIEIVLGMSYVF